LGIRIIFIAQGIDTNDKKWELSLHAQSMIDQFVVTMYADNIRAAQEGLFERRLVFGSISYGYCGAIIEGEFSRTGKPRRRLAIDDTTAQVVRLIFDLFVVKRRGLNEIARILNDDQSIPLPRRCRGGRWTNDTVRRVLTNTRYRGYWQYGLTESVYISEADYVGKVTRAEPLKAAQIEELRIIGDDVWFAAADRIKKNGHGHGGRKSKDGDIASRPDALNGLLYCEGHERPLVVTGAFGSHMACPVCMCLPRRKRKLTSWLNRAVAFGQFCDCVAQHILADGDLVEQAINACRKAADEHQRPNPAAESRLKTSLEKIKRAIEFTLKSPGDTEEDQATSSKVLRELRMDQARVEAELRALHAARAAKPKIPTIKEVRALLKELAEHLANAAESSEPGDRAILRQLVEELTGGRIIVSQQGGRERQRGWLHGVFRLRLLNVVVDRISNGTVSTADDCVEVAIDFKRPLTIDAKAEIAWQMLQNGKRHAVIANALGCVGAYVTRLLKYYTKKHGIPWVDGRKLRRNFPAANRKPACHKEIADHVMELFDKELLYEEIATECGVDVITIRKSVRWWHKEHGLVAPNGRERAGRIQRDRNRSKRQA
jgi:hypothetical protein